jgi:hypothetical protein
MIDQSTVDELATLYADARMSAENFTEACAAQAEKHQLSKGALRRFIAAKHKDKLDSLNGEAQDLATLLEEIA